MTSKLKNDDTYMLNLTIEELNLIGYLISECDDISFEKELNSIIDKIKKLQ